MVGARGGSEYPTANERQARRSVNGQKNDILDSVKRMGLQISRTSVKIQVDKLTRSSNQDRTQPLTVIGLDETSESAP